MGKAIPTKIKPYPGLVKAWRARQGSPGRSYDPPGKKRSPRHKKPKRGTVNRKPYKRGKRGGVAWTGGKTPRYDPRDYRGRTRKRAKDKLEQIWHTFEKKINPIASIAGFLITLIGIGKQSFDEWCGKGWGAKEYFTQGIPNEIKTLFSMGPHEGYGTIEHLTFKFTNPESHWCPPFLVSLATYLLCKLGIADMALSILTNKSKKIIAPIQKLSGGILIASAIGGLILPGSGEKPTSGNPGHSTTTTHNPSSMWS